MTRSIAPEAAEHRGVEVAPPAAARPRAASAEPDERTVTWIIPLVVLIIGSFMSVLDTSIVNVAIPKMQVALSAAPDDIEWVVTAYTLVLGIVVPLTGWMGSRIGMVRLYILSMIGFSLTSALCGVAWDLNSMVAFRVLQAIPGGILPVITMTMLLRIVPPSKLGTAMGLYGLGVVVAPAVGPTLGGYFVEYVDWRLIFVVNVPVGLVGAVAAAAVFPRDRPTSWPRFDTWGFVTVAYGMAALLLAFSKGHDWGWTGYRILLLFVSSALVLATWVVIELEVDHPLIDLRIMLTWPYINSLLLMAFAMAGLFTGLFFIPQFLQVVQGMQALDTGLVLLPAAAVLALMMPISGRLYDTIGPRWLAVAGMLVMGYASYMLAQLSPDTPRSTVEIAMAIRNFGVGLCMMPIMSSGLAALPKTLSGSGSAMNNVMQRVVSSVAVAAFGGMNAAAAAQLLADRGALPRGGAAALPEITAAKALGPEGMLPMYEQLTREITTQTYNNGFYLVTILCVMGAVLALPLRSGPAKVAGGEPAIVEM
ncbi:MAG TPA: DHA2 family efflux MFS transporter permease subunit [Pseudonocardia sp.]|nr:DHA2 family efflux MFS transporter permease subunit [Pseudonocardia sp.]